MLTRNTNFWSLERTCETSAEPYRAVVLRRRRIGFSFSGSSVTNSDLPYPAASSFISAAKYLLAENATYLTLTLSSHNNSHISSHNNFPADFYANTSLSTLNIKANTPRTSSETTNSHNNPPPQLSATAFRNFVKTGSPGSKRVDYFAFHICNSTGDHLTIRRQRHEVHWSLGHCLVICHCILVIQISSHRFRLARAGLPHYRFGLMDSPQHNVTRRGFLKTAATAAAALSVSTLSPLAAGVIGDRKIKLGLDNFAVRAMKWKADALIDYAVKLKTDSLFITDLDAFESFDESYLQGLRKKAADQDLQIQLGSWSICPTSKAFRNNRGTAEEHLGLGIRVAKALGSPVFRVILGTQEDRKTPGGIEARIEDTVKVCKALRSRALDAGVKIAVENHAGDMQARELVQLIEAAGKDYVGANMDSGNAVWTLEEPMTSLEILGPYALTTSLRDSAIWESEKGATVQWTAMGDGTVDLKAYFKRFAELCPNIPVHIETISGFNREFAYLQPGFWDLFPKMPARDFAKFLALAKQGKPREGWKAPQGVPREKAEQEYQKQEIEKSIRYCKEVLGLGLKA